MIAVYIRVSTREQLNGYGLDVQKTQVLNYLKNQRIDLNLVKMYEDAGYSANSLSRPALKQLLSDVKSKKIHTIYIYKLDRMFRNLKHQIELLDFFNQIEVALICITENIDYSSANGRLFVNIKGSVQQWERDSVSERTKDGLYQSALEGNYSKGGKPPLGYRRVNNKLVVHPEESEIVREIFYLVYKTASLRETAEIISIKYPQYFLNIDIYKIKTIIKNFIYKGTYKTDDICIEGHSPAIVEADLFDTVQKIDLSFWKTEHTYLFGKSIRDKTGAVFYYASGTSKQGTRYYYYRLGRVYLSEKKLLELFLIVYKERYLVDAYESVIHEEKKKLRDKKERIIELFVNGEINEKIYIDTLKTLSSLEEKLIGNTSVHTSDISEKSTDNEIRKFIKKVLDIVQYDIILKKVTFKFNDGKSYTVKY